MTLKVKQADGTWKAMGEDRNVCTVYPINSTPWGSAAIQFYGDLVVDYRDWSAGGSASTNAWASTFKNAASLTIRRPEEHTGTLPIVNSVSGWTRLETMHVDPGVKVLRYAGAAGGATALREVTSMGDTYACTSFGSAFSGCSALERIAPFEAGGVTSASYLVSMFAGCQSLRTPGIYGARYSFSVNGTAMQADDLNKLFVDLGTPAASAQINIGNTPGAATCDRSIATAKGWTVIG